MSVPDRRVCTGPAATPQCSRHDGARPLQGSRNDPSVAWMIRVWCIARCERRNQSGLRRRSDVINFNLRDSRSAAPTEAIMYTLSSSSIAGTSGGQFITTQRSPCTTCPPAHLDSEPVRGATSTRPLNGATIPDGNIDPRTQTLRGTPIPCASTRWASSGCRNPKLVQLLWEQIPDFHCPCPNLPRLCTLCPSTHARQKKEREKGYLMTTPSGGLPPL